MALISAGTGLQWWKVGKLRKNLSSGENTKVLHSDCNSYSGKGKSKLQSSIGSIISFRAVPVIITFVLSSHVILTILPWLSK